MADETRIRYFLTNHQNQPLELHLPGGVVVIGPRGEREVLESDLSVPQVRVLARARIVGSRAVAPETTKPEPPKRSSKTKTPEKEA